MERTIYLHGSLGKTYGRDPIVINADTTYLVMQGLICRFGNKFKQIIRDGQWHILKGKKANKDDMGAEEVQFTLGKTSELHIIPAVSGKSAVARIIIGVVLIIVGVWTGNPYAIQAGLALVIGGAVELLTPKPKINSTQQAGQNPSFMFNGAVNVTEQGGPVPIILGRVRHCGCVVLSAGLTTENLTTG